jgi:serine/threonine protein kinase
MSSSAVPTPAGGESAEHVTGYRDLRLIGAGASSAVYRAHQEALDRVVALKVLIVDADEAARHRFLDEVRLTARLSGHPHVVTALDAGMTWSGRPYLATEFFESGSLADLLRSRGPLPVAEVARIGTKIADALAAVHALDITHGDVKPGNVFVSAFGEPALGDFGMAALRAPRGGGAGAATSGPVRAGHGAGPDGFTPLHAAPEVLAGARPDVLADVYALGSTLYELLAGRPAFGAPDGDVQALAAAVAEQEPPALPGEPGLPLAAIIRRAMAKLPSERWPSAGALAEALRTEAHLPAAQPTPVETSSASDAGPQDHAATASAAPDAVPVSPTSPAAPEIIVDQTAQAARPRWEHPVTSAAGTVDGPWGSAVPPLSATMVRADRALTAEPADSGEPAGKGRAVLAAAGAALLGAAIAFAFAGWRGPPAKQGAAAPPPTSSAPPAAAVPSQALDASRPSNVVVTPDDKDLSKARVDWHIAPGNDHALAIQIQSALAGSRPQLVLVPARTSTYQVGGLLPDSGYCFAVGSVVAWGSPSQIAWSRSQCIRGAKVVAEPSATPVTDGSQS